MANTTNPTHNGARLPWGTVFELLRFRWDNTPTWVRDAAQKPALDAPRDVDDVELRALLVFAGTALGNGDPQVPLHLEAHRVLSLVPDAVGASLFGVPMPS